MTGYFYRLLLFLILFGIPLGHNASAQYADKSGNLVNHQEWGRLLTKYVDSKGDVDYKSFKDDIVSLEQYLDYLGGFTPGEDWPQEEQLGYYINLYNAATVKRILDHYPVNSIRNIKQPWARKWIKVGSEKLSLNQIEHSILRKMDEPRIHFAINCASASCPKLYKEPFEASELEQQLESVTWAFINDPFRNEISEGNIALSPLFKWYKGDFTKAGSLLDFISRYSLKAIQEDVKVEYKKYDWSLNEQ